MSRKLVVVALVLILLQRWYARQALARARQAFHKTSKLFVVTGAASGIGRNTAKRLLALGHRVIALDINVSALDGLRAEANAGERLRTQRLDVTDAQAWRDLYAGIEARGEAVDAHLNIAGFLAAGKAYELDTKKVDLHFDVNVKGVIFGSMVASEHMLRRVAADPAAKASGCHIVNIASIAGLLSVPHIALYSSSKNAVRAYTRALAVELLGSGVYASALCPGPCRTPMLDEVHGDPDADVIFAADTIFTPDDITDAIVNDILIQRPHQYVMPQSFRLTGARSLCVIWRGGAHHALDRAALAAENAPEWLAPLIRHITLAKGRASSAAYVPGSRR